MSDGLHKAAEATAHAAIAPLKAAKEGELAELSTSGDGIALAPQKKAGEKPSKIPQPIVPPRWKSVHHIIIHAARGGLRSFLLAFAMRGGISFLIKLVRVVSGRLPFIRALQAFFAPECKRFGLMVGSFSVLWKLLSNLIFYYRGQQSKWNGAIAGAIAGGVAILFEEKETRLGIAQQFFVRSMQAGYNALKARNKVYLPYGDSLLFMIACGSIMYAYIMQPDTIPREYYSWMVKTANVPAPVLDLNRTNYRARELGNLAVDPNHVLDIIRNNKAGYHPEVLDKALNYLQARGNTMPLVPCSVLHPTHPTCTRYNAHLFKKVFMTILPVYGALNFVPMVLLKGKSLIQNPALLARRGAFNTIRSSLFLAVYVFIYMVGICTQRSFGALDLPDYLSFFKRDHKLWYYILGLACSSSIFIEHKSRRSELAMYVLPKGLQSLWMVFHRRGQIFRIPNFEVYMASAATGILMSVYQTEPQHMSSLLFKVMEKVMGRY
ncbi:hypothetical protein BC832DRAFT_345902 [Gaertneriomyces semiglobifer]|nr:hypothetical protein BC832DRAFT_345902 [Gaertneriomyces semiglobifer]